MGARPIGNGAPSVRDQVIRHYRRRLDKAYDHTRCKYLHDEPVSEPVYLAAMLEDLEAGRTIQLAHGDIPVAIRPHPFTWSLYELRGDELVGVPAWKPGQPRPRAWTI